MSEVRLSAQVRTEFGKGGARPTRRAGLIPAVIYGHGADPRHVSLPAREFTNAVRHGGANVLLTLEVDGKDELVIPKAIQRNPLKDIFEHLDLLSVRRGEKVTVDVPITVVGDVAPGGVLVQENTAVSVEAEATNLPTGIELDITPLAIGTSVTAGDLVLAEGSSLITEPDLLIIAINDAPTAAQLDAEMAEAADELGIVTPEPESAEGDAAGESSDSE